jgi:hypothetical protein
MESQTIERQTNTQPHEIAVYDNLSAAQQAQQSLEQANLSLQNVRIEGDISDYETVAAMGTTVGAEAGLLIGAFFGGTLGILFFTLYSTLVYGELVNTNVGRIAIIGLAIAGSLLGVLVGNRVRSAHLPNQNQKGNPNAPRRFRLLAAGHTDDIAKAAEVLGQTAS